MPDTMRRILETIRRDGPIPFARFMETALYDPEGGYYAREGGPGGPPADFETSPHVHAAFGRLIARQVAEIADRAAPGREPFHLIEAGPGTGSLAGDLIAALAEARPDLARRTRVILVEISDALRRRQQRTLAGETATRVASIEWAGWPELLERRFEEPFAGCVVANEFLDALPVHLAEWRDGALWEVCVGAASDSFTELLEPAGSALTRHLDGLRRDDGIDLTEGQRAEFGLATLTWVDDLGRLFGDAGRGGAILIDYGHPARELYGEGRHAGTLMTYRRHTAGSDPYAHVGEQDLTAHVDFSSIARRAREAGFDTAPLTTQMKFLVALGLARLVADVPPGAAGMPDRVGLHRLMAAEGMGEVFKVLLLSRGFPAGDLRGAHDPFREVTG